jgi:hypothetical protein
VYGEAMPQGEGAEHVQRGLPVDHVIDALPGVADGQRVAGVVHQHPRRGQQVPAHRRALHEHAAIPGRCRLEQQRGRLVAARLARRQREAQRQASDRGRTRAAERGGAHALER